MPFAHCCIDAQQQQQQKMSTTNDESRSKSKPPTMRSQAIATPCRDDPNLHMFNIQTTNSNSSKMIDAFTTMDMLASRCLHRTQQHCFRYSLHTQQQTDYINKHTTAFSTRTVQSATCATALLALDAVRAIASVLHARSTHPPHSPTKSQLPN
jgi:hypothetical protein